MTRHTFPKGGDEHLLGAEAQRRRAAKRVQSNDPAAKNSKIPLERAFTYCGDPQPSEAERVRRVWNNGHMPLYQSLKEAGKLIRAVDRVNASK